MSLKIIKDFLLYWFNIFLIIGCIIIVVIVNIFIISLICDLLLFIFLIKSGSVGISK